MDRLVLLGLLHETTWRGKMSLKIFGVSMRRDGIRLMRKRASLIQGSPCRICVSVVDWNAIATSSSYRTANYSIEEFKLRNWSTEARADGKVIQQRELKLLTVFQQLTALGLLTSKGHGCDRLTTRKNSMRKTETGPLFRNKGSGANYQYGSMVHCIRNSAPMMFSS